MESELQKLEDQLKATEGPYLCGTQVSSVDLNIAPKLKHADVALGQIASWPFPKRFVAVAKYLHKTMPARPSWTASYYSSQLVVNGWKYHGNEWRQKEGVPPLPDTTNRTEAEC